MTTQIEPGTLSGLLLEKAVKVLDGSWALDGTDMQALYRHEHLPGAQFFDLEAITNQKSSLPHMAPSPEQFAEAVGKMGIAKTDHVVIYDRQGLFSAARVWWTFKLMGHEKVQVLRGGLPAWIGEGFPVTDQVAAITPTVYTPAGIQKIIININDLRSTLKASDSLILDARPKARFDGTAPEPRAGLRCGHMPGSRSLPFADLVNNGALKPAGELEAIFQAYGVADAQTIVTSCGSGVTAAIISMALYEIGHTAVHLYDGSWAEWGQEILDTPVVTGA